jgi:putative ABC transport system permease protein
VILLLKIAARNITRNGRRSLMTMLAIAVGAVAMLLFGEFIAFMILGLQTTMVQRIGHLSVSRNGYFELGSGNPAQYGISRYQDVIRLIENDPELKPMLNVVTPNVTLFGIAGNFDVDASKTFFGSGVVPSDRERMRHWNEYGFERTQPAQAPALADAEPSRGVVGVGLARILGLCRPLELGNCAEPAKPAQGAPAAPDKAVQDFSELARRDLGPAKPAPGNGLPRIDLLAATAGGAPNVVSLYVARAEPQGVKELDDSYVVMHIDLAQQLLYGRGEHKAVSLVLQLHRSEDIPAARARLAALFKQHGLALEVHDFTELQPVYKQIIGMMGAIFSFIAAIMGVIVLFTVVNTMSMSVMERVNEIGTTRALGVRRAGIRRQFVAEGLLLGVLGASAGLALGAAIAFAVNRAGLSWTPPMQARPVPLRLLANGMETLVLSVWLGLVALATLAALIPANRAARMPVVDALRHV